MNNQTSILDQIIDDHGAAQAAMLPVAPVEVAAPAVAVNLSPAYRGTAKSLANIPADQFLKASGLDWKAIPMPVGTIGKNETRLIEGFKAIHRSDNGNCLGIATDQYKPVQNAQMMQQFIEFAKAGELTMSHAGELDGGKKVYAVAKTGLSRVVEFKNTGAGLDYQAKKDARAAAGFKVGDMLTLDFVMSNGHTPGTSFKVKSRGERVACLNGVTLEGGNEVIFSMTHRSTYDGTQAAKIRQVIANAVAAFHRYGNAADAMAQTRATRAINTAFIVELYQPELIAKAAEKLLLPSAFATATHETLGQRVIDEILNRDKMILDMDDFSRTTNKVVDCLDTQAGGELSKGTLWHGFNAVTYYVDHIQGRSADTGVQSALFGQGDQTKGKAQQLASTYVQRLKACN